MSRNVIEQIITEIDDKYIAETIGYADNRNENSNHKSRVMKYTTRLAACIALLLVLSVSTLSIAAAVGNIPAYDILYGLYPDIAEKLTPVNMSCEDNGILMNVDAVNVDGSEANIYVSLQDLTGDRIDETTDLFDSYNIKTSKDFMVSCEIAGCDMVDYDAESRKATFLIYIQNQNKNGKPINIKGKKLTFSVSRFLSGKQDIERELSELSLSATPTKPQLQKVEDIQIRGYMGEEDMDMTHMNFLTPDAEHSFSPVDGVNVNAYGYVDGKLHVQVHYDDIIQFDNHGFVYLKNANGNIIDCTQSIAFWDADETGSNEEYIFDVSEENDLTGYALWGEFITCHSLTEGHFEVTFPIKDR